MCLFGTGTKFEFRLNGGIDMNELLNLAHPDVSDTSEYGGKAAGLHDLIALDIAAVPVGFAIGASNHGRMDAEFQTSLMAAYAELCKAMRDTKLQVAVRSSATDEDGADTSFAGQHETVLGVQGEQALSDAVRSVWASGSRESAMEYRDGHGLDTDDVRMAVVVQAMIPAEMAAVAFSRNPVTGEREVMVNVIPGLGEPLVSGEVTPDTEIHPERGERTVYIGRKIFRLELASTGGTIQIENDDPMRPTFAGNEVAQLAGYTRELEKFHGRAVDIEAAYYHQQWWLLQCRPVTT
jgi:phosphoenolpyruvate synthase/pyruvate phosphate dikinase